MAQGISKTDTHKRNNKQSSTTFTRKQSTMNCFFACNYSAYFSTYPLSPLAEEYSSQRSRQRIQICYRLQPWAPQWNAGWSSLTLQQPDLRNEQDTSYTIKIITRSNIYKN